MARIDAAERKRQARQQRQLVSAQRRRLAEIEAEKRAELIAPSHVRHAVTDAGGRVVRGAMVIVDGGRVRRASVLDRLRSHGEEREAKGLASLITARRVKAAERLQIDYSEVGAGIGVSASDYLRLSGSNGAGTDPHGGVRAQIDTRDRLDRALASLGSFTDIVVPVVLDGVDVRSWSQARGYDRQQAVGYLAAALERLAEFYDPIKIRSAGNGAVRSVELRTA
jgi:uncharacterized protein DUF6456